MIFFREFSRWDLEHFHQAKTGCFGQNTWKIISLWQLAFFPTGMIFDNLCIFRIPMKKLVASCIATPQKDRRVQILGGCQKLAADHKSISTVLWRMNIPNCQLFWCEQKGTRLINRFYPPVSIHKDVEHPESRSFSCMNPWFYFVFPGFFW